MVVRRTEADQERLCLQWDGMALQLLLDRGSLAAAASPAIMERRWVVCTARSTRGATLIANVSASSYFLVVASLLTRPSDNRFNGVHLEELQGEIATMCKDQHGCRYLQKKLEEGVPEHRDMIFRETFPHFAELMTGELVDGLRVPILVSDKSSRYRPFRQLSLPEAP